MKRRIISFLGLFAIAGVFTTSTSDAATVSDPVTTGSAHELFLGFRASGGQGASTSYLVKLGAASSFSTTDGTNITLSLGNLGLDLVATYGSAWYSRPDLFWGVFGSSTSASPTVYGSRERDSVGTPSSPWALLDLTARNSVDTNIATNVLNGIGGYRGATATANSAVATLQTNSSNSSSYNTQVATAGTTDFGSLSQWSSIEGDFGSGSAQTVLDVWRISGSAVTYRGAFSINDNGVIRYNYTTVPEPSVALLLGLAGFAAGSFRPRRTAAHSAIYK